MISFFLTDGLFSTSISMFQFCSWSISMFITLWGNMYIPHICAYLDYSMPILPLGAIPIHWETIPVFMQCCRPVCSMPRNDTWGKRGFGYFVRHKHYYGPPLHQIHILRYGVPEGVFMGWQLILLSVFGAVDEALASCLHGGPLLCF